MLQPQSMTVSCVTTRAQLHRLKRGSGTRGPHRPSHPAELLVETAELGHRACMPDPETSPLHALRWPRETSIVSSGALKIVSHPRRYRIRVAEVKVASERVGIQI
jgi:hypothetical protein